MCPARIPEQCPLGPRLVRLARVAPLEVPAASRAVALAVRVEQVGRVVVPVVSRVEVRAVPAPPALVPVVVHPVVVRVVPAASKAEVREGRVLVGRPPER